jgi:hypothetical protein
VRWLWKLAGLALMVGALTGLVMVDRPLDETVALHAAEPRAAEPLPPAPDAPAPPTGPRAAAAGSLPDWSGASFLP